MSHSCALDFAATDGGISLSVRPGSRQGSRLGTSAQSSRVPLQSPHAPAPPSTAPNRYMYTDDSSEFAPQQFGLHGSFAAGPSAVWRRVQTSREAVPYYYSEVLGASRWSRPAAEVLGPERSAHVQRLAPAVLRTLASDWQAVSPEGSNP